MNCQNHPEVAAAAYCRTCGMPVCEECRREAFGTVFCAQHAPAPSNAPPPGPDYAAPGAMPPPPPPPGGFNPGAFNAGGYAPMPPRPAYTSGSPALAFFLGLIPGVGAIYNGQYVKGLVHAIIWGLLMSMANSRAAHGFEALFVIVIIAWWAYMALEAHRTAQLLQAGLPVDDYSSLINTRGSHNVPLAAVALIFLGVLLLLHTLDVLDFEAVARFWPVVLIAAGVYLLWGRFAAGQSEPAREARHER
jgi:hypothetical protein